MYVLSTLKCFIATDALTQNMDISYTPKFHVSYAHVPDMLFEMYGFFDMGEDAIERWHQTRMDHHTRIRALRSYQK